MAFNIISVSMYNTSKYNSPLFGIWLLTTIYYRSRDGAETHS